MTRKIERSIKRQLFTAIIIWFALLAAPSASAEPFFSNMQTSDITCYVNNNPVYTRMIDGRQYLFLPSMSDFTDISFTFTGNQSVISVNNQTAVIKSGQSFDLAALCPDAPEDNECDITFIRGMSQTPIKIMKSENIASVFVTSDDPLNKGQAYVNQIKGNKASGYIGVFGSDGSVIYSGGLKQIKARGNSTWGLPKKPYQIKLSDAADLIETGDPDEANKTWILLANDYDDTLIRNNVTYDLASEVNMRYSPNCRPADLYYDGAYQGTYLISEKNEIGKGRVDIHDLQKDIENANPGVTDFNSLPAAESANAYNNKYRYVTGLNDPDGDITGGYLMELDYRLRADREKSLFTTTRGYSDMAGGYDVVIKNPEYMPQKSMEYISGFFQEFENAVFSGGVNPDTGKSYNKYIDTESLVKWFLIQELSQNDDMFLSSSFFYKPSGTDMIYAGPVWDFDIAYGIGSFFMGHDTYLASQRTTLGAALLYIPSFCRELEKVYDDEVYPLVNDVILSDDENAARGRLRSIKGYCAEIASSKKMNDILWSKNDGSESGDSVAFLRNFIADRSRYLYGINWENISDAARFLDIRLDCAYANAVNYVAAKQIFSGTGSESFSPDGAMTRAMAVTILHRLAGYPNAETKSNFSDVPDDAWFSDAAAWAAEVDILHGYPDGTFKPDANITYQEFLKLFYEFEQKYNDVGFSGDAEQNNSAADWAKDAFEWADKHDITENITTSPYENLPRYAAATLIYNCDMKLQAARGDV